MTQTCPLPKPPCGPPCPDDQPVLNLTAEGPDDEIFVGIFDFPNDPPINGNYSTLGCKAWCYSTLSQADADHCAELQAVQCGGGILYGNDVQSVSCPPGKVCVLLPGGELPPQYTISGAQLILAAGTYTDLTKDLANTAAQQQLQQFFDTSLGSQPPLLACQTQGGGGDTTPWNQSGAQYCNVPIVPGSPVTVPGVTAIGINFDVQPSPCSPPFAGVADYWQFIIDRTFGPFSGPKNITVSGMVTGSMPPPVLPPDCTWTGTLIVGTIGTVDMAVHNPPIVGPTQIVTPHAFSVSGVIPALTTCNVSIQTFLGATIGQNMRMTGTVVIT